MQDNGKLVARNAVGNAVWISYDIHNNGTWLFPFPEDRSKNTEGCIYKGDTLYVGESLFQNEYLLSENRKFAAVMQENGNFVVVSTDFLLWHTYTAFTTGRRLVLQENGRIVLRDENDNPLWFSDTLNSGAVTLTMQNNGKLVARNTDGNYVWINNDIVNGGAGLFPEPSLYISAVDPTNTYIELHNPTETPISAKGLYLSNDNGDYFMWQMPLVIVRPNQRVLIKVCDEINSGDMVLARMQTDFDLAHGDTLRLSDAGGNFLWVYEVGR